MASRKWIKKLFDEISAWVQEGIIDSRQKEQIVSRYGGHMEYSRLVNTIITLGSILIGLGVFLFVASNWEWLGRFEKIAIIFSVIALFHCAGYYFRYVKSAYRGLAEGFTLMGAFAFGSGIWLIAQMYQIHYNFSAGIVFWILGIVPLVYLCRSWPILSLVSILSLIWLFSYQAYYFQRQVWGFFPLLAVVLFLSYFQKQRFSVFVMIAAFAGWLGHFWFLHYYNQGLFIGAENSFFFAHLFFVAVYCAFGFLLYSLGMWQERTEKFIDFSFLFKFCGISFIAVSLYSLSFAHHYPAFSYANLFAPLPVIILIEILVIASGILLIRLSQKSKDWRDEFEIKGIVVVFALVFLSTGIACVAPRWASLIFNLVLLAVSLGWMYVSFLKRSEGLFRLTIVIFFIDVLTRYADVFWKMMPRSLLFMLGGALLIGGAVYADRKRRAFETRMRDK